MLKEIICDKILEGKMVFGAGLNAIVGDETASNSIGKSSALLMIDFAFGGDMYGKREDIIKNIGHHEVKMHFLFDSKEYYFMRNTAEPNIVHKCDEKYNVVGTIRNVDYKQFLYDMYHVNAEPLKFGELVTQFCRVYGKNNYNEKEPLYPGYPQTAQDRVSYLVKLFGFYNDIAEQKAVVDAALDRKQSYNKVVRLKLVAPVKNKTEYNNILKDIGRLEGEADVIKTQIASQSLNLTSEQLNQISILKTQLSRIQKEKSLVINGISRLKDNFKDTTEEREIDLNQIKVFFPAAEIHKIDDINQFHIRITDILKEEIEKKLREEEDDLARLIQQEEVVVERIKKVALTDNSSNLALDRLIDTKQTIDSLIQGKTSYELTQHLSIDYKESKELYENMLESVLSRIMFDINKEMEVLNATILGEGKKSPLISLTPTRYFIKSEDDTGTGTGYRVLITFDLAVFNLTSLPILIHDSLLFKNIEDEALDGILTLYESKTNKQVFISIDKVGSYGQQVQMIVECHKVLQLSEEHPFYGKSWKE